jgi:methylated-DNA-[protein]-cysteine S-methyltransferase
MKKAFLYETSLGSVLIAENGDAVTDLCKKEQIDFDDYIIEETPLLRRAAQELRQYLAGQRQAFSVPLKPSGTEFQHKVWHALLAIPYGTTCSYQAVAQAIGQPKASRAIGMANHRNPIMIMIPCHRVIGANGKLVGYGGGLGTKAQLLALEAEHCNH